MSTFGLTWNLKSPDRNKQFISNIPRMFLLNINLKALLSKIIAEWQSDLFFIITCIFLWNVKSYFLWKIFLSVSKPAVLTDTLRITCWNPSKGFNQLPLTLLSSIAVPGLCFHSISSSMPRFLFWKINRLHVYHMKRPLIMWTGKTGLQSD